MDFEEAEEENMDFGEKEEILDSEDNIFEESIGGHREKHYRILGEETVKQLQQNDIAEVSDLLSVSKGIACTLLLQNNWNINSVTEKWLVNDEGVCAVIKISRKRRSENYCKICFEIVEGSNTLSVACGHPFCRDCWKNYLTFWINNGPGCLKIRCPDPKCDAVSGLDMVELLVSYEDRAKYYQYLYRSYIEFNENRKWCPAPGCEFAVEFDYASGPGIGPELGPEFYDVTCDCSYKFCWNCTEECHRPVDCETVSKWLEKNSSEADNVTWIAAYTKPCPKCKRPIEKNQGCNHMTCGQPCTHQFCWLCLEPWKGDDRCNSYRIGKKADTKQKEDARAYLERYAHYYERWASNHKSRDIARADMIRARQDSEYSFVVEAWEQIVECRRVLKWSYAYGYYMDVDELEKKTFFEYLQGEAERALERLHYCVEKEVEKEIEKAAVLKCVKADCRLADFVAKLKCLTAVTRNYFKNLVMALENDLSEVGCRGSGSGEACTSGGG